MFRNNDFERTSYAKDILRDRFYKRLERDGYWVIIIIASWMMFFFAGTAAILLTGGGTVEALQFGCSLLVWGAFVRTVLVWHITWSVNSIGHRWGYRNFDTEEGSRNNLFVGIISNGEGWHNNHHAHPQSARHGHYWWELDVTWLTIKVLGAIGLVRRIVVASTH